MNPSMLFRYSDNRLDFETADVANSFLEINFWTTNGRTQGSIKLDEKELADLIVHLNKQLAKITAKQPPAPTPIKTKNRKQ